MVKTILNMPNNDILGGISSSLLKQFRKEFLQIIKISYELERCYAKGQDSISKDIKAFEDVARQFNKKYRDLQLKLMKNTDALHLKVFANEKSIKDFFANSASKMSGLRSIGLTGFNQADAADTERFTSMLEGMKDAVFVSYSDVASGTSTLAAVFDKKEKMVEIFYKIDELSSGNSADFRICAYYALRKKPDSRIKLEEKLSAFGFLEIVKEDRAHEYYDRFNPRFTE